MTTDQITSLVAKQLDIPEVDVMEVINFKHRTLHQKLKENISVEDTNLGTFHIREKKLLHRIKELTAIKEAYERKPLTISIQKKIDTAQKDLSDLNKKLSELQANTGRF